MVTPTLDCKRYRTTALGVHVFRDSLMILDVVEALWVRELNKYFKGISF